MDIRCERCRAEYRFKDDAIGPAGLTVRCSKCGHVFKVRRPAGPAVVPAVPVAEAGWTLRKKRSGDVYAVADLAQLQRWVAERRAIREDEASVAGGPWRRLADIPELGTAFAVAQAAKRSAGGAAESAGPGGARREVAHTTSVFPGPGRPPGPMQTEIAYKVRDAPGAEGTEPAWAQAPGDEDRGPALTPLFTPDEPETPRTDREPAFTDPEPTLRAASGGPERGAFPLTGSAPLSPPEPAPLSALIDERPPPTRAAPRARKRSPVARVLGTLAVLITLVALGGVAVALLKPEWLDPFFAGLDVAGARKALAPKPPAGPAGGTSAGTPDGPSGQGAPTGASRPATDQSRTLSPSVPGTEDGMPTRSTDGGAPAGVNAAPEARAPASTQAPAGVASAAGSAGASAPSEGATPPVPGTEAAGPSGPTGGAGPTPAPDGQPSPAAAGGPQAPSTAAPVAPVPGTAPQAPAVARPVPGTAPQAPAVARPVPGTAPQAPAVARPVPGTAPQAPAVTRPVPGTGAGAPPAPQAGPVPGTTQATSPAGATPAPDADALKAVAPAPPPTPTKPPPPKLTGVAAQLAQARSLRARGRAESALDLYGQVLAKEPQNADALAGRGLCYFDLGQTPNAVEAFKAALAADGKNGDALLGLAETYRYDSRREDALAYYEKYLEAHPRGPGASIARANIQALKE